MTDEALKDLKKKYQDWKNDMIDYNTSIIKKISLENDIKELEENEIVKEYLQKKVEVERYTSIINGIKEIRGCTLKYGEDKILESCGIIGSTNGIYVCIGEYQKRLQTYFEGNMMYFKNVPDKMCLLPINSEAGVYRAYLDIESGECVCKSKTMDMDSFEEENTVLYPDCDDPIEFYNKVRLMFLRECVHNTQDTAITKVLELKK